MEMNKKILLIGGGGHCKSVIDSLLEMEYYSEIGIVDKGSSIGNNIFGIPIVGCDNDLLKLYESGYNNAFITVGSIGNPSTRITLFHKLKKIGFDIPNIIDPTSTISKHITLEEGIYIGKNVVINAGSYIKKNAIINTGSVIEHDCVIGEFSHISPGSVLCGEVKVEDNTHIGARSVIRQGIKVGKNTIIGMGSVVLKNIPDNVIAYGNPCKEVGIL